MDFSQDNGPALMNDPHGSENKTPIPGQDALQILLDHVSMLVCHVLPDLSIAYANNSFLKTFSANANPGALLKLPHLTGTENFLPVKHFFDKGFKGETVAFGWEIRSTASCILYDVRLSPVRQNGNVTGLMVSFGEMPLNAKPDAENQVTDAENKLGHFAAIVHSSTDPIISKTLDGIVTSWNKSAERIFGFTAAEMIGQPIIRLIPADRLGEEPQILNRLKRGETVDTFETKRLTKDGRLLDISLTISPVKNSSGVVIGASKIARDITAQKKLSEALRKSEERLRMAGESAQLGIWEYDPENQTVLWSDQCREIFGLRESAVISEPFIIEHILPQDREAFSATINKALDPLNPNTFQIEFRIVRDKDKEVRWIKLKGKVHFDENKKPYRLIGTMVDFSDERQRDQKILENEERLRMAIQSTGLGTWEYNVHNGKLTWSGQCRRIYGVPERMDIDIDFFRQHLHEDDQAMVNAGIAEALKAEGPGHFDEQFRITRYSDKQVRWVRSQGKASFTSEGEVERFVGTILDITEAKRQEDELRSSVELFTTMADNVPAMIWMSGDDKFRDFFNKTWLEYTGRSIEEESDEGWLKGVHPDDVKHCIENYNRSLQEQKGFYTEYRLRRHDGQYRWVADRSVPRYNMDGSFAGFISACIDIDDQKNFREKIHASELRLQTISNASPVGLWMTDANAMNTFVNETWIEWTGIPFPEQLGTGWLAKVLDEDKVDAPAKFIEVLKKREKYTAEFRINRVDGQVRWCLTEGYPYYDITGEFAGYAGSVTDITDIKKLEERKDDFIKMASHELKTPITSIKGYIQLLLNIYDETNEEKFQAARTTVRSSLQTISKQVSKLTRLISELLDLSRIESGKLELYKSSFSLHDLVEETVQEVRHTTTRHAIIIHNDFEGKVYADRDRLSQVLLNLLTNAIKYSPDAEKVEVYIRRENDKALISVADYGIGIDKKDHERIFERFYRVEGKSEQTFPGFGIGLFIASEIIARHGGTVRVESQKGRGSVFMLELPVTN